MPAMTTAQPVLDAAAMIADTEAEILRVVSDRDPSTVGVYEMVRYHLGLDGSGASAGKRMRPLLGLLASDDDEVIARYRGFGWALGLAFQLNDDLLGIWGAEQATGKKPSDIARRKKTLPVIYAFEHAGPDDRARLTALYGNGGPTADEVDEVIAILERTGARDFTRTEARRRRDEALAELDAAGVVDPEARARLEEIIVSVIAA